MTTPRWSHRSVGIFARIRDKGTPAPAVRVLLTVETQGGERGLACTGMTDERGYCSLALTPLAYFEDIKALRVTADEPQAKPVDIWSRVRDGDPCSLVELEVSGASKPCCGKGRVGTGTLAFAPQDLRVSPQSVAVNPGLLFGDGGCERMLPAHHATREFTVQEVMELPLTGARKTTWEKVFEGTPVAALGLCNDYHLTWTPEGHGLGQLVYSLPLSPGEKVDLAVVEWSRESLSRREERTAFDERLIHELRHDRSVDESMTGAVREWSRSSEQEGGAGLSVDGLISKVIGLSVSAAGGAACLETSARRKLEATTTQQLADLVVQASQAQRTLTSTVVVQSSQAERDSVQTRSITNHNHCHTLTIQYYEVLRHFRVITELAKREMVVLVQPPSTLTFRFLNGERDALAVDARNVLRHRRLLEQALLDPSLATSFALLERCLFVTQGLGTWADTGPTVFAAEGTSVTGITANIVHAPAEETEAPAMPAQHPTIDALHIVTYSSDGRDFYLGSATIGFFGEAVPDLEYKFDASFCGTGNPNNLAVGAGTKRRCFEIPVERMDLARMSSVSFGLRGKSGSGSNDLPPFTRFELWGTRGDHAELLAEREAANTGDTLNGTDSQSLAHTFTLDPRKYGRGSAELAEDRAASPAIPASALFKIWKLFQHLASNVHHYHRVLWMNEDPTARTARLAQITLPGGVRLLDVVASKPVGVSGNLVAYPLRLDALAAFAGSSGSGAWVDDKMQELLGDAQTIEERIVSLPTRGLFAEGMLGRCNACEKADVTRSLDWEQSAATREPPSINVQMGSRQGTDDTSPATMPTSVVSIVNPPAAPDPSAMTSGLSLLATPGLFPNGAQGGLGTLLGQLAAGTISLEEARANARAVLDAGQPAGVPSPKTLRDYLSLVDAAATSGDIDAESRRRIIGDVLEKLPNVMGSAQPKSDAILDGQTYVVCGWSDYDRGIMAEIRLKIAAMWMVALLDLVSRFFEVAVATSWRGVVVDGLVDLAFASLSGISEEDARTAVRLSVRSAIYDNQEPRVDKERRECTFEREFWKRLYVRLGGVLDNL
jgi:hypothetical protein